MKTQICKYCCPQGGAIFKKDFGIFQHHKTREWMEEHAWVNVCTNCGSYKPQRKRKPRMTFDEVLAQPDDSKLKRAKDRAYFHMLSDNGYQKQYIKLAKEYVAKGEAKGITKFPILVIWYYNDFHSNALSKLVGKRQPKAWDIDYHIGRMKAQLEQTKEYIMENPL
jgi:hypothetical protein